MADLVFERRRQEIGIVVQVENGLELFFIPVLKGAGKVLAGLRHRAFLVDLGKPAGQERHRGMIERAQQLPLPAVPHAGPYGADVAYGQDQQVFEPFCRLHGCREGLDGLAVGKIARLRGHAHGEVFQHQPLDQVRALLRKAEPWAQAARHLGAGDGMVFPPSLGDVVDQYRDVERLAVLDFRQQARRKRMVLTDQVAFDGRQDADGADQVLVHRVVMIHVELHHRDDLAEGRDEAAQHAGLVHLAQQRFRPVARGDDGQKQPVRLLVGAQLLVDQLERIRQQVPGIGMDVEVVVVSQLEDAQQVDRIALEDLFVGNVDAAVIVDEVGRPGNLAHRETNRADEPVDAGNRFCLLLLQFRANDQGEVPHFLGDQEVVLHETLHIEQAAMGKVFQPGRHFPLDVEGKPFLRPPGQEMHVAADSPKKPFGTLEAAEFVGGEEPRLHQFPRPRHPVIVFADPEQRMQITQTAFAVLDVGFDQIA